MALPREFIVVTEDGKEHCVLSAVQYREIHTQDARGEIPVSGQLRLADGSPVNLIDEETFLLVLTGQRAKLKAK